MKRASTNAQPDERFVVIVRWFWIVLLITILAKTALKPNMHTVYPTYAGAGRIWWQEDGRPKHENVDYLSRQYGPFFAALIGPFSFFPDRIGGVLWSGVSLAVLLTGLDQFLRHVDCGRLTSNEKAGVYALVPWFGLASIYNGQANILIAGCFLWGAAAVASKRWNIAAIVLATAVCVKIYTIALALVFLGLFPRKLMPRFLLAALALSLAPAILQPWSATVERYSRFATYLASGEHYNYNFVLLDARAIMNRWIGHVSPSMFIAVQLATGLLIMAACLRRREASGSSREATMVAYLLASIWLVLFGPATEEATYLLAGPAVAWIIVDAVHRGVSRDWLAVIGLLAALIGPLQTSILGETVRRGVLDYKLAPIALAVVFTWQVRRTLSSKESPSAKKEGSPLPQTISLESDGELQSRSMERNRSVVPAR